MQDAKQDAKLFEINDLRNVRTYEVMGSPIYVMDDFYKHPQAILDLIEQRSPKLWKAWDGSRNGVDYIDRRHDLRLPGMPQVMKQVGKLIGRRAKNDHFVTNLTRFVNRQFNDYESNYWWPHRDDGLNVLVFFNNHKEEYSGTNLFHPDNPGATTDEAITPWLPKNEWALIHTIKGRFNRLVCFDGEKFPHAMCIDDDSYFGDRDRVNQVLFFKPRFRMAQIPSILRNAKRRVMKRLRKTPPMAKIVGLGAVLFIVLGFLHAVHVGRSDDVEPYLWAVSFFLVLQGILTLVFLMRQR